jgi:hypothetical protein
MPFALPAVAKRLEEPVSIFGRDPGRSIANLRTRNVETLRKSSSGSLGTDYGSNACEVMTVSFGNRNTLVISTWPTAMGATRLEAGYRRDRCLSTIGHPSHRPIPQLPAC